MGPNSNLENLEKEEQLERSHSENWRVTFVVGARPPVVSSQLACVRARFLVLGDSALIRRLHTQPANQRPAAGGPSALLLRIHVRGYPEMMTSRPRDA